MRGKATSRPPRCPTDQRGVPRPYGGSPDIGAYEAQYPTRFASLSGTPPASLSPTFTIPYGTATVEIGGEITSGTQIPTGTVVITLDGTTQSTAIASSDGAFDAILTASALHAASSPYQITYSYAGGNGFNQVFAIRFLTVAPILTVTADDETEAFGSNPPALTASYQGFVNGDTVASLTEPVVLSTTAAAYSPPGNYPIVATGASSPDYAISFVNGTLTVTQPRAPQERGAVAFVATLYQEMLGRVADAVGIALLAHTNRRRRGQT